MKCILCVQSRSGIIWISKDRNLKIKERKLKGVFEISLEPHIDGRGFFMRTFDQKLFREAGLKQEWVQENHARSDKKNIIRGLHFQLPPHSETKMVRCVSGEILDVFVDLRKNSGTFGQWDSIELSAENKRMILIPRGFAHGYRTLTDVSEVLYKVDNYYNPNSECGIMWDDDDLNIDWKIGEDENYYLSEKDKFNISFKEFVSKYKFMDI